MFHHRPRDRSGITRLEALLLLLVGVIGLGLVVIWTSRPRSGDSGLRMECTNNLRQLGIALHNYHDVNNAFPTESSSQPSFYQPLVGYLTMSSVDPPAPMNSLIKEYLCPSRRKTAMAPGKRDYGYAASTGTGSAGTSVLDSPKPVSLEEITKANGAMNTLLLSHLWMDPKHYSGGDPTDLGWATKNHSRSINDTAKPDTDSSGSTAHIGGIHPNAMPSLFADGHVQQVPYSWPHWNKAWAYDNRTEFPLP